MANNDYIPNQDSKLSLFLENFFQVCDGNSTVLGLSPAELTTIENAKNNFVIDLQSVETNKASYAASISEKDEQRRQSVAIVRQFAREFKANPAVSPGLLSQLGIVNPSAQTPVTPVTNVTVLGCSDGINVISFNRNGNAHPTSFVIEYAETISGPWFLAGVVTKTKFSHPDNVPGDQKFYRIISTRAGTSSPPYCPSCGLSWRELRRELHRVRGLSRPRRSESLLTSAEGPRDGPAWWEDFLPFPSVCD